MLEKVILLADKVAPSLVRLDLVLLLTASRVEPEDTFPCILKGIEKIKKNPKLL